MSMSDKSKQLAEIYISALKRIGLVGEAETDDDGDLIIKFKMLDVGSFFIVADADKDPEFMRLVFPNFYLSKNETSVLNTLNVVNLKCKAVKLWARNSGDEMSVSAGIESFLAGADELPAEDLLVATLGRYISAIRSGVAVFVKEIGGEI